MKIAMISEHASPLATIGGVDAGGQNLHVAELAVALVRQGHEVTVYTRRDCAELAGRVRTPDGYDVVHVPAGPAVPLPKDDLLPYMHEFGRWLSRRWASQDQAPDVVHAHFWMSGLAAVEATQRLDTPVVLTYHALGSVKRRHQRGADPSPPARITLEEELGRGVEAVVAQCVDEVTELARMGVPRDNVVTIPSGVDLGRFQPSGPMAPRGGRPRLLTVGRLVPRKGYDHLVRAMTGIPDAELVIVGGPPEGLERDQEARRLHDLAQRLGVADRVRLTGAVPRALMPSWYRSADVLACTPWYEPFGLTPLEAMACGVPVVTYALGGLQDSVVDSVTGVHVRPGDVSQLTTALRDLIDDEARRRRLGRAALVRARRQYSWAHSAARLASLYAEVRARRSELEKVAL
ncbi:MAG TPA: glycosyltransferase [Micromonosporaceae bacterium]